jgi:hypothetical protein
VVFLRTLMYVLEKALKLRLGRAHSHPRVSLFTTFLLVPIRFCASDKTSSANTITVSSLIFRFVYVIINCLTD